MDPLSSSLLGGFVGSTLTVVITKVLDFLSQRDHNNFALKKIYFEKKLSAAETAVSTFHKAYTLNISLANLYDSFSVDKHDFNSEFFTEINDVLSKRLTAVEEFAQSSLNAYVLFFDITDKHRLNETLYSGFYTCVSELMNFKTPLQEAIDLYDEKKDDPEADSLWDEVEKITGEMKSKFQNLSGFLKRINQETDRQMQIMKREMKKYE